MNAKEIDPSRGRKRDFCTDSYSTDTHTYTCGKHFSKHHRASHTVTARARRNKIDRVRDTFISGRACAHPELHQSPLHCCPRGHAERPEQDLRMTITGGQQLEEGWFAGRRAGGWVGGHQQAARAHAIPQGGKSRGCVGWEGSNPRLHGPHILTMTS